MLKNFSRKRGEGLTNTKYADQPFQVNNNTTEKKIITRLILQLFD